jgi:energy-coupling factor transport system ATP-binding protein
MMDIRFENVTFQYSSAVVALRDVDLLIRQGEKVAIIGENGAGKSTLVKHMNGLLRPANGRVLVGDWDTREHPASKIAARVGLAFQNPDDQLFKRSVEAEVAFGPQNLGFSAEETATAVAEVLALVGLTDDAERHPHDLHSSKRRLVALAAILAMRTAVVIIDEPTIGQDAAGVSLLGEIVQRLHEDGRTVIAISHHIEFCAANFERIVVMSEGRVVADGSPQVVFLQDDILTEAHVQAPQLVRLAKTLGVPDLRGLLDASQD